MARRARWSWRDALGQVAVAVGSPADAGASGAAVGAWPAMTAQWSFDAARWSEDQRRVAFAIRMAQARFGIGFARVPEVALESGFSAPKARRVLRELGELDAAVEVKRGCWTLRPAAESASRAYERRTAGGVGSC